MNNNKLEQIKSYATILVAELHKIVFDDSVFDKSKVVLLLAEELECFMFSIDICEKKTNVIPFRRDKVCSINTALAAFSQPLQTPRTYGGDSDRENLPDPY